MVLLTPSTFGVTDTSTGRWIPKTLSGISYGTNGFRLTFADSSSDAAVGDDTSGNGNDLTPNNVDRTDVRTDTPTNTFPTMRNFNASYVQTLAEVIFNILQLEQINFIRLFQLTSKGSENFMLSVE